MATDGKLLKKAKDAHSDLRRKHDAEMEQRTRRVFAASPRAAELDAQIRASVADFLGIALGAETSAAPESVFEKNKALREKLREEVQRAGFPANYLDDEFLCPKCNDTGYIKTDMCDCLKTLYHAEKRKALSSLLKLGEETFESFNLSYYDDKPVGDTGISPRQNMEMILETCNQYAKKFGKNSMNLFFNGAPGLGKTFLSASIARVIAERDFSVVYETAGAIFAKYEDEQFSKVKGEEYDETRAEIKRYLECDLLIIDDLGTEMTTTFTIEALYEIINTRLITNRKTIVNSNMTIDEMRERYSEQIMSRLEGEYQVLTFYGDDIRKKKNTERL